MFGRRPPARHEDRAMQFRRPAAMSAAACRCRSTWTSVRPAMCWVTNNWQYWPAALEKVDEALSTLGGGQGVVVFYGWPSRFDAVDRRAARALGRRR